VASLRPGLGQIHLPQGQRSSKRRIGGPRRRPSVLGKLVRGVPPPRMGAHCSTKAWPSTVRNPASCGGSRHVAALAMRMQAPEAQPRAARAPASSMRFCYPQTQCKPVPESNIRGQPRFDGDLGHRHSSTLSNSFPLAMTLKHQLCMPGPPCRESTGNLVPARSPADRR